MEKLKALLLKYREALLYLFFGGLTTLLSIGLFWLFTRCMALPPLWAFAALGLVAGALSQIGDLLASLVKRHCGIKDFGNIFPGHGGMLDRFDGILFCGAACYFFFKGFGL